MLLTLASSTVATALSGKLSLTSAPAHQSAAVFSCMQDGCIPKRLCGFYRLWWDKHNILAQSQWQVVCRPTPILVRSKCGITLDELWIRPLPGLLLLILECPYNQGAPSAELFSGH